MAVTYALVKKAAIEVIDDFSKLDVSAEYGTKYNGKTKLEKLGLSGPVLAVMPPRFNKSLRAVTGSSWHPVGAIDLVALKTIGDAILLACGQSSTIVPEGEPT
jgi:hypothetical protein